VDAGRLSSPPQPLHSKNGVTSRSQKIRHPSASLPASVSVFARPALLPRPATRDIFPPWRPQVLLALHICRSLLTRPSSPLRVSHHPPPLTFFLVTPRCSRSSKYAAKIHSYPSCRKIFVPTALTSPPSKRMAHNPAPFCFLTQIHSFVFCCVSVCNPLELFILVYCLQGIWDRRAPSNPTIRHHSDLLDLIRYSAGHYATGGSSLNLGYFL